MYFILNVADFKTYNKFLSKLKISCNSTVTLPYIMQSGTGRCESFYERRVRTSIALVLTLGMRKIC